MSVGYLKVETKNDEPAQNVFFAFYWSVFTVVAFPTCLLTYEVILGDGYISNWSKTQTQVKH